MRATGSTVGEAYAIAPDTYVVPGWWSFPGSGLGLPLGTLVVRGQATAVIDTGPAPLADDWLAAVLALVDPAEVRWIVATAADAVRAGCVAALHELAPRATVVVPGHGCAVIDLGRGEAVHLHEAPPPPTLGALAEASTVPGPAPVPGQLVVEVRKERLLWTDLVGGAFARPALDVAALDDETVIEGMARRARPLGADELERTATLGLRVLASPIGPIARGRGVIRALELARRAETRRPASGPSLAALLAPLGPPPWTVPTPGA